MRGAYRIDNVDFAVVVGVVTVEAGRWASEKKETQGVESVLERQGAVGVRITADKGDLVAVRETGDRGRRAVAVLDNDRDSTGFLPRGKYRSDFPTRPHVDLPGFHATNQNPRIPGRREPAAPDRHWNLHAQLRAVR